MNRAGTYFFDTTVIVRNRGKLVQAEVDRVSRTCSLGLSCMTWVYIRLGGRIIKRRWQDIILTKIHGETVDSQILLENVINPYREINIE